MTNQDAESMGQARGVSKIDPSIGQTPKYKEKQTYKCVACGHIVKAYELSSIRCPKCEYKGLDPVVETPNQNQPNISEEAKKIYDLLFPDGFSVIYPETEQDEGYPTVKRVENLIAQKETEARIDELTNLPHSYNMGDQPQRHYHITESTITDRIKELKNTINNKGGKG